MTSSLVVHRPGGLAPLVGADAIEAATINAPQVACPVVHHFGPGIYMREVLLPAAPGGTLVVGRHHKHPHMSQCLRGRLILLNDDGSRREIVAPWMGQTPAGRKVAVILEDVVFVNIYATSITDLDELESWMFDDSEVFQQSAAQRFAMEQAQRSPDRADFDAFCDEHEWSTGWVRAQSERTDDQVPFPEGEGRKVVIRPSPIEGKGVFSTSPHAAGEVIGTARVGPFRTPLGRWTNHAKDPNARFEAVSGGLVLVAARPIRGCNGGDNGEEITVDYRAAVRAARELE